MRGGAGESVCVGTVCVYYFSFLAGSMLNDSYFPDGTLGNDNLWAIQSNYIYCVCTQKKSSILIMNRGFSHTGCATV